MELVWGYVLTRGYSLRAATLIAGVLGRAGERGQKRRLADAEEGIVTWQTPQDVAKYIAREAQAKAEEEAERNKLEGFGNETVLSREEFLNTEVLKDILQQTVGKQ